MAIEVELPDGTVLEAPDGSDPSTVAKGYLAKNPQSGKAPENQGLLSKYADWGLNIGTGALKEAVIEPGQAIYGAAKQAVTHPIDTAQGIKSGYNKLTDYVENSNPVSMAVDIGSGVANTVAKDVSQMKTGEGLGRTIADVATLGIPARAGAKALGLVGDGSKAAAGAGKAAAETASSAYRAIDAEKAAKESQLAAERTTAEKQHDELRKAHEEDAQKRHQEAIDKARQEEQIAVAKAENERARAESLAKAKESQGLKSVRTWAETGVKPHLKAKREQLELAEKTEKAAQKIAYEESGLPVADQGRPLEGRGELLEDKARKTMLEKFKNALSEQKDSPAFTNYKNRWTELQKVTPFPKSEPGIELLEKLERYISPAKGSELTEATAAQAEEAKKIRELILGKTPLDPAGKEIPGEGRKPASVEIIDQHYRNLKELEHSFRPTGASDGGSRVEFGKMRKDLEDALIKYVGDDFWPNAEYQADSVERNKFDDKIGKAFVEFQKGKKYGEGRFRVAASDALSMAFKDSASAASFKDMIGEEAFNDIATQRISNEIHGKTPEQIEAWKNRYANAWISDVPGGIRMVERYQESLARSAHNVQGYKQAVQNSQKTVQAAVKELRTTVQKLKSDTEKTKSAAESSVSSTKAKAANERQTAVAKAGEQFEKDKAKIGSAREKLAAKTQKDFDKRQEAIKKESEAKRAAVEKSLRGLLVGESPESQVSVFRQHARPALEGVLPPEQIDQLEAEISKIDASESIKARNARIATVIKRAIQIGAGVWTYNKLEGNPYARSQYMQ